MNKRLKKVKLKLVKLELLYVQVSKIRQHYYIYLNRHLFMKHYVAVLL